MIIDKDNIKILLILLIVGLGLGYAYINSDLNINGIAQVNSANWDVHWANIQVTNGSVSASSPTISNQTTVNYSVILNTPGDYYEFTVDAVNGGTIAAMIDTIDSKLNGSTITTLPAYLNYTVTYSNDVPLAANHLLAANTSEKYKVRVEYSTDIELNQIPATNQTLSLQFTVTYRQATEDAIKVRETKYTANLYDTNVTGNNLIWLGQAIPNGITQYNSASEALAALRTATGENNLQLYLKHTVQGGIVTESYIEFIVTQSMANSNPGMTAGTYALRGLDTYDMNATSTNYCKSEYYNSTTGECVSPYYASNKETLLQAFGSSYCNDSSSYIFCTVSGLRSFADVYGLSNASFNGVWGCGISDNGSSNCDYAYG